MNDILIKQQLAKMQFNLYQAESLLKELEEDSDEAVELKKDIARLRLVCNNLNNNINLSDLHANI